MALKPVGCAMCSERKNLQLHHVIRQQDLRKEHIDADLWHDERNLLPVCTTCHANHHARSKPIPAYKLKTQTLVFGYQVLGPKAFDYFQRHYPEPDSRLQALLNSWGKA